MDAEPETLVISTAGTFGGEAVLGRVEDAQRSERYDRLMEEHGPALRRAAAAYEANPADREDLLQEIALAIWRALPGFRGECSERTFVFRIAHNRGLTHRSRRRPAPVDLYEADGIADDRHDPEGSIDAERRRGRLMAAVRRLPPLQREVIVLSLEGLTHAEIAEVLGITENNVAVRLSRAREALRRDLEWEGGPR